MKNKLSHTGIITTKNGKPDKIKLPSLQSGTSLREYMEEEVSAPFKVAKTLLNALDGKIPEKKFTQKKWATEELLKIGVGGGYKAAELLRKNLNINVDLEATSTDDLRRERDKLLLQIK